MSAESRTPDCKHRRQIPVGQMERVTVTFESCPWCEVDRLKAELSALRARCEGLEKALQPAFIALDAIDKRTERSHERTGRAAQVTCFYAVQQARAALKDKT